VKKKKMDAEQKKVQGDMSAHALPPGPPSRTASFEDTPAVAAEKKKQSSSSSSDSDSDTDSDSEKKKGKALQSPMGVQRSTPTGTRVATTFTAPPVTHRRTARGSTAGSGSPTPSSPAGTTKTVAAGSVNTARNFVLGVVLLIAVWFVVRFTLM